MERDSKLSCFIRQLLAWKKLITDGERDVAVLVKAMKKFIEKEPLAKIDYLKVVDAKSMRQVEKLFGSVIVAM